MLRYLLNLWLYPVLGMMFAAGTVVGDVGGTGGGDGGGSNSSGDSSGMGDAGGQGGNGEVSGDAEGEEAGISDAGAGAESQGTGETDPNALVDSGDGRKIPAKYQELFKNDKALREMYYSQAVLKRTFPGGVKDAIALAKSVEEFGGVEAVEQLQSELGTFHADAELFEKDPGKWIEQAFAENSDVSLKAFAHSLDFVADNHPEHYNHLMAKVIKNDLDSSLPVADIHALLAGLKDNPKAQELAGQLAAYYNHRNKLAKQIPEKQVDPQQKKLDARDAELNKKSQDIRNKTINSEAAPHMNGQIDSSLKKAAKDAGFDLAKLQKDQPNRYGRFLKDVRRAVHENVLSDTKWLDRYSAALATNDTAKCVRLLNARHDQAINGVGDTPGVVAPVFHEWFGPPKAAVRQQTANGGNRSQNQNGNRGGGNGGNGGGRETPVLVNALPAAKDINYNDPKTDKWEGIYRLKTGKLIQVKRP
jgi:hypothetical protein